VPIGAAIAGVASLGSAVIGSNAASSASAAQAQAQQNALTSQNANFNNALQFQQGAFNTAQGALNPFIQSGSSVLPTLQSLLTPGASQTAALSQLPGFQFQSQYGTMATTNALAARGLGGSTGPLAEGISNYNQGLAGTSFQSLVQQLQAYAGMGTSAAGSLASAAGQAGSNVGNLTANTNNTIGATQTNLGNAQASGILGSANALQSGLTGASNSTVNALLLSKLLPGSGGATAGTGNGIYGPTLNSSGLPAAG
jgi:hypothetical protein